MQVTVSNTATKAENKTQDSANREKTNKRKKERSGTFCSKFKEKYTRNVYNAQINIHVKEIQEKGLVNSRKMKANL